MEARLLHRPAAELGIRIIALDRPGYGQSDFLPGRSLSAWPQDVLNVARALNISRFAVLGVSGGGPYALACAAGLPGCVTAAATVCGLGPLHLFRSSAGMARSRRLGCALLRRMRWLIRPAYALLQRNMRRQLRATLEEFIVHASPRDRAIFSQPDVQTTLRESYAEALRPHDARGGARDLHLYLSPWDFDVTSISVPTTLWHGDADRIVPHLMTESLAETIPGSEAVILPGEGHYSLPIDHGATILERLIAA